MTLTASTVAGARTLNSGRHALQSKGTCRRNSCSSPTGCSSPATPVLRGCGHEERHGGRIGLVSRPHADQENEFLKTIAHSRQDVTFAYVIPFGNKDAALKAAQG